MLRNEIRRWFMRKRRAKFQAKIHRNRKSGSNSQRIFYGFVKLEFQMLRIQMKNNTLVLPSQISSALREYSRFNILRHTFQSRALPENFFSSTFTRGGEISAEIYETMTLPWHTINFSLRRMRWKQFYEIFQSGNRDQMIVLEFPIERYGTMRYVYIQWHVHKIKCSI